MLPPSICHKLVEKNADGIVLVDQQGVVTFANPAAEGMFGFSLPGREFGFPVSAGETTEIDLINHGQSPRVVEMRVVEIAHEKKERFFLISLRDLTDRVRMETQLRQAMAAAQEAAHAKSRFLSHVSHELRTPLNAVIGLSGLLLDRMMGELNPTQDEFLRDILQGGRELLHIVDNLLELVDAESRADGKTRIAWLELRPFLANRLSGVHDLAREKGIALLVDWEQVPERIRSNERMLGRILDQLLFNAVKFTPTGGEVRLSVRQPDLSSESGNQLEMRVADTGVGIRPENLKTIFQPFSQEDDSDQRAFGGLGVGLALIRKLVERLGGQIRAETRAPEAGSVFYLVIPV